MKDTAFLLRFFTEEIRQTQVLFFFFLQILSIILSTETDYILHEREVGYRYESTEYTLTM